MLRMLLAVALLLGINGAMGDEFFVSPDGSTDYPTIQDAVDAASLGDIISLHDGYFQGVGNRDIALYARHLQFRSISDNPHACVIDCQGASRAFRLYSDDQSSFSGISFINGRAVLSEGGNWQANCGGAVFVESGSPSFNACIFGDNTAGDDGGALFLQASVGLGFIVQDCQFIANDANGSYGTSLGGAIRVAGLGFGTIQSSLFTGNQSAHSGGALAVGYQPSWAVEILNCTIAHNHCSSYGSAIYLDTNSRLHIQASIISNNTGGGSYWMVCGEIVELEVSCTDAFGNDGADWPLHHACFAPFDAGDVYGNFSLDPEYCSSTPETDLNYRLQDDSPCLPETSPCGEFVGANNDLPCSHPAVLESSWGQVKSLY